MCVIRTEEKRVQVRHLSLVVLVVSNDPKDGFLGAMRMICLMDCLRIAVARSHW